MAFYYLSQILGKGVFTARGERVARIKDVIAGLEVPNSEGQISLEAYPPISGLLVEISHRPIFVPWLQIEHLGPEGARLRSAKISLLRFERREGEALLARDILDKQLIDIDGRRVIRANDLQLFGTDGSVRLTAVDVSTEALLRRLTFGLLFAGTEQTATHQSGGSHRMSRHRTPAAKLINWADIEPLASDTSDVRLRQSHERLALLNPVDIAHILDDLSYKQGAEIIESLDDETAADTLQEMDEDRQADIVETMDRERAADILEEMDPDDAADLLADLDAGQVRDLLDRMDREEAEDVQELLAYAENTAGGMMTSEFITVSGTMTVDQAIVYLRLVDDAPDSIDYLYVVDAEEAAVDWATREAEGGKLIGVVSLRDLVLSDGQLTLGEIMVADYVWVRADESPETVARLMAEYNLVALPVLDEEEQLLGTITVDDAMEVLLPDRLSPRLPHVFS